MKGIIRTWFSFVIFFSFFGPSLLTQLVVNEKQIMMEEIQVGVILDMGSREGKMIQTCISMAISDFYGVHSSYKTRVVLLPRDSKGQPLLALSSALDLLENFKVKAIIGAQTSMEARFLAELGDKTKVPVISFSAPTTSSLNKYPCFVQISQGETSQAMGVAAIVEAFKWREVIIIHEDSDDWTDNFIPHLVNSLQDKNIHIANKIPLATSSDDSKIIEVLHKLKTLHQRVFIVHLSPLLTPRFFRNAQRIGMMSKGFVWMLTANSMNNLHFTESSMTGVIGLKSYIPASNELHNFTSRLRKKFLAEHDMEEIVESSAFGLWAYDVAWGLAKAAERAKAKHIWTNKPDNHEMKLFEEILQFKFKGLSGDFQIVNGKLQVSNAFEIVNIIGGSERRVGLWTCIGNISNHAYGIQLSDIEDIIWPGGTATIPIGYVIHTNHKKLRIAVVKSTGFPELVNINRDLETNITTITGFCIDVFETAIGAVGYAVDYELIPFLNASGLSSHSDVIDQIYFQKYDAAVGDITITANRSLYVDFTLPFTDLGVGMITPKGSKNMWIFLKPLTADLWLSTAGFFVLIGFVIWLIERRINKEFQGPISQQIGIIFWFSFSTLVFAHKEKLLSNLSKFVVIVWVFVVLILTSSYTATLTSMITVQNIQLNPKGNYIGYQEGSFTRGVISNLNFKNTNLRPFATPEEYPNALSKGIKKGGVSAIVDEIPYIKIFLQIYSEDYYMVKSMPTTNGFAFVFRKGSPLVPDMSRAIAKLREEGKLSMMESAWFKSRSTFTSGDSTSNNVQPLTLDSFRGLFLITGVSSALALTILCTFVLCENWHVLRSCNLSDLIRTRLKFIREYASTKTFSRAPGETNVIHPE